MNKITFYLDKECELCARGLAKVKKLEAGFYPNKPALVYGSKFISGEKKGKSAGKIEIVPDYNSCGILTHWHVR